LKAHLHNGKTYAALEYNTSTVTLATRSGRPDIITWADVDYLVGDDGLERHREVMHGTPVIVVQAPPDPQWHPYPGAPLPQRECPQTDFDAATELVDAIDNEEARAAVCAALAQCYEGEAKRKLWGRLTAQQRQRLLTLPCLFVV
jgi:hypothetical protein